MARDNSWISALSRPRPERDPAEIDDAVAEADQAPISGKDGKK